MRSPGRAHPLASPLVPAGPHRLGRVVGRVTPSGLPGSESWRRPSSSSPPHGYLTHTTPGGPCSRYHSQGMRNSVAMMQTAPCSTQRPCLYRHTHTRTYGHTQTQTSDPQCESDADPQMPPKSVQGRQAGTNCESTPTVATLTYCHSVRPAPEHPVAMRAGYETPPPTGNSVSDVYVQGPEGSSGFCWCSVASRAQSPGVRSPRPYTREAALPRAYASALPTPD
jgi:hypothetical protein